MTPYACRFVCVNVRACYASVVHRSTTTRRFRRSAEPIVMILRNLFRIIKARSAGAFDVERWFVVLFSRPSAHSLAVTQRMPVLAT